MKSLSIFALVAGTAFSAVANPTQFSTGEPTGEPTILTIYEVNLSEEAEPKNSPEHTVRTYIENFNERDFEEMRAVLSRNFTNQGLNRDGSLTEVQKIDDLKRMMTGQDVVAPDSQNNIITVTGVTDKYATVVLITGPEGQRWKEHITLVRSGSSWKIEKVFWSFV
jgi:hypothetical protein